MCNYFEKKINGYDGNFSLLDRNLINQNQAGDYYVWVKNVYKEYFSKADLLCQSKFYIRYYRAKKMIYSSAQMLMEAKSSLENECVVAYYYLMYYALFQAMQANLILCIRYDDDKVIQLSHKNVKQYFEEQFCKNKKCPLNEKIIDLIEKLRSCREYFSYAMPFNLTDKAIIDIKNVEECVGECIQLFNLHCFIIFQDIRKSVGFDFSHECEIKQYLMTTCSRLKEDFFTDDADADFWNEYKNHSGGDILPLSMAFEHDFDKYGTYDSEVYEAMKMPRTQKIASQALRFIYDIVF